MYTSVLMVKFLGTRLCHGSTRYEKCTIYTLYTIYTFAQYTINNRQLYTIYNTHISILNCTLKRLVGVCMYGGGVLTNPPPEIHHQLLGLTDVQVVVVASVSQVCTSSLRLIHCRR